MREIDFWFSIGSTYSYLTVMRLEGAAAEAGVAVRWRPFNVRVIMGEYGNSPFVGKPVKTAYMWRDMERRAAEHGVAIAVPAPYPLAELELANRIAVLGDQEGWCADYVRATYCRWFQAGEAPGEAPNLPASLSEIGQDPDDVAARAKGETIGAALAANTDAAKAAGVFGSPSFVVGGELFWGDDRLEAALAWTGS